MTELEKLANRVEAPLEIERLITRSMYRDFRRRYVLALRANQESRNEK